MTVPEFLILFTLIVVIFYWIDTIRVKELAVIHGQNACKDAGVTFLDLTVEIRKVRLKRNPRGSVVFYREYQFEFSSDGIRRYDGEIIMLGKQLLNLQLSAYPSVIEAESSDIEAKAENNLANTKGITINSTIGDAVVDIKDAKAKKKPPSISGYR